MTTKVKIENQGPGDVIVHTLGHSGPNDGAPDTKVVGEPALILAGDSTELYVHSQQSLAIQEA